jgi:hypothetical protein
MTKICSKCKIEKNVDERISNAYWRNKGFEIVKKGF